MSLWQHLNESERIAAIQTAAADKQIEERAVEKDCLKERIEYGVRLRKCPSGYLRGIFSGDGRIRLGFPWMYGLECAEVSCRVAVAGGVGCGGHVRTLGSNSF